MLYLTLMLQLGCITSEIDKSPGDFPDNLSDDYDNDGLSEFDGDCDDYRGNGPHYRGNGAAGLHVNICNNRGVMSAVGQKTSFFQCLPEKYVYVPGFGHPFSGVNVDGWVTTP